MDSLNRDAPTVQRAGLGALWGGQEVEASFVPKTKKKKFLSADLFGFSVVFFVLVTLSRFSRLVTTTFFLLACLTGHHLPPDLVRTWPMSPCTHVHLVCASCVLSSPSKHFSSPSTLSFFVPYSHWHWCFHRSRRVFRAVIFSAGSPPTQPHTCTTTFLTLLSFSFSVQ